MLTFSPDTAIRRRPNEGIGLIEIVVVVAIISSAFVAILAALAIYLQGGLYAADKVRALYLAEEAVEAVRFLRDEGYTANITPLIGAGARYFDPAAGGWSVSTTDTPIFGTFSRSITLTAVYRRTSDNDIVPSTSADPKSVDPNTAKVSVSVTWPRGTYQTTSYVTNLYEN